jgi:acetolactate synthase-1/2/3 large subunit
VSGTSLFNPDFYALARSFGMAAARITHKEEIDDVIQAAFKAKAPILIEVNTSLDAMLP